METMLKNAKAAKNQVSRLTTDQKNAALHAMADALLACEDTILKANRQDLEAAKGTVSDVIAGPAAADSRPDRRYGGGHPSGGCPAGPGGTCA